MANLFHVMGIAVPMLLQGLGYTVVVSLVGIIASLIFGSVLALMCICENSFLRGIAGVYIKIFRCTPFMVQVYLAYYVPPAFGIKIPALAVGIIILSLYAASYAAVIFESGIKSVNKGQSEAATAMNIPWFKMIRRILVPQIYGIILPPLTELFLQTVKDSSMLSVITVAELTMMTNKAIGVTFNPVGVYLCTAVFYWTLNLCIEFTSKHFEKKSFKFYV
ncbi:MAG: amino acid ABC transporter permease [Clostridiales bacterium]|nr:amino acid ABC transporter permease [Clostridiales bacterium]